MTLTKSLLLLALALPLSSQADIFKKKVKDPLVHPGSDYCVAVRAIESKNFDDRKKYVDEVMKPVANDLRMFLKQITPHERTIIKVEGSNSRRLMDLDRRHTNMSNKYTKNRKVKGRNFVSATDDNYPDKKFWIVEHVVDEKPWAISVELSTPEKEEEQIKAEIEKHYLAISKEAYLNRKVPGDCFGTEEEEKAINDNAREAGKEVEEQKKGKKKKKGPGSSKQ